MGFKLTTSGSWGEFESYLKKAARGDLLSSLEKFGSMGVAALEAATPELTGRAAGSWSYEIVQRSGYYSIRWKNNDMIDGVPLVILLTYGHGTRQGGYVQGRNFIMPAMEPVFAQIEAEFDKVVRG